MANRRKHLALSMFVQRLPSSKGRNGAEPRNSPRGPEYAEWLDIVQLLERGKFDLAFFADFVGNGGAEARRGPGPGGGRSFDPLTLLSALAVTTKNIGLVATVNTNLSVPYTVARQLASIDHLSGGRAGWNIVSSLSEGAIATFGVEERTREQRYERAAEYVELTRKLWDSWDDEPAADGLREAHPVHHHGKYFNSDSLLDIARPIQGHPVFFQAGASEDGREFAAKYAELIYASAQTLEDAQTFYRDVKGRLAKYGRAPEHLIVSPGLFFHVGESRQEAEEKHEQFLEQAQPKTAEEVYNRFSFFGVDIRGHNVDAPLPEGLPEPENNRGRWQQAVQLARRHNLTPRQLIVRFTAVQGHRTVIGTADDIADQLADWFHNEGADGYNLKPWRRDNLEQFIDKVVPALQKRGVFRKDYESSSLRTNLALPYPRNPYTKPAAAPKAVARSAEPLTSGAHA